MHATYRVIYRNACVNTCLYTRTYTYTCTQEISLNIKAILKFKDRSINNAYITYQELICSYDRPVCFARSSFCVLEG